MRKKIIHNDLSLLSILAGCLIIPCLAAAEEDKTVQVDDLYEIEVIVFKNNSPDLSKEYWPDRKLSYPADMQSLVVNSGNQSTAENLWELVQVEEAHSLRLEKFDSSSIRSKYRKALEELTEENPFPQLPAALTCLPEESRALNDQANRIQSSSNYSVLFHEAWLQPLYADQPGTSILIQAGDHFDENYEIDGSLHFRRTRFIHVDADLWMTEFAVYDNALQRRADVEKRLYASLTVKNLLNDHPRIREYELNRHQYTPHRKFPVKETRKLSENELNYIDHPAFGLLIRIEPFKIPVSDDDQ